jgi:hypothetical protein
VKAARKAVKPWVGFIAGKDESEEEGGRLDGGGVSAGVEVNRVWTF